MTPNKSLMARGVALTLTACAAPTVSTDMGPMQYDASGTMPCSAGTPTYSEACGGRVVRKSDGSAEIWISEIAVRDKPAYRVLNISRGKLTTRDGAPLQVSRDADMWSVSISGKEYYRFADALITGG